MNIIPIFTVFVADESLTQEVNNLSEVNDKKFSYDTTFYMTPLICRHPFLKNDPAFPCAFLFHETKTTETHKCFFKYIQEVFLFDFSRILCQKFIKFFRNYQILKKRVL